MHRATTTLLHFDLLFAATQQRDGRMARPTGHCPDARSDYDFTLNQNVYGNKNNCTSFSEHAVFGVFGRRQCDPNGAGNAAYNWIP